MKEILNYAIFAIIFYFLLTEVFEKFSLGKENLEQENLEQENLEQENLEQENLEQENLVQENLEQENLVQENLEPVVNPGNLQVGTNATTSPANLNVTGSSTTEGDVVFGGKDANGFMWDNEADTGWACLRPALDTPGNPKGSRLCFNKDHGIVGFGPDGKLDLAGSLTINSFDNGNKFNLVGSGGYFRLQNAGGKDIVTVGQGGSDMYVPSLWTKNITTDGTITANSSIYTKGVSGGFYMPSRNGTGEEFAWYNQDGSKVMLWNKVNGNILSVDVSGNTGIVGNLSVGGSIILNSDTKPLQIGPYSNNNINFLKDYGIQISSAINTRISTGGLIVDSNIIAGGNITSSGDIAGSIGKGQVRLGSWAGRPAVWAYDVDSPLLLHNDGSKIVQIGASTTYPSDLFATGNVTIIKTLYLSNNIWHKSGDDKNRLKFEANSRTLYGSGDGSHEFRTGVNADWSAMVLNSDANLSLYGGITIGGGVETIKDNPNLKKNGGNLIINNAGANFLTLNDGTTLTKTSVRVWRDNASQLTFVGQNDANTDNSWPGVVLDCKLSIVKANNVVQLSDQRLKTNIEPLRNVISSIKQINGVKFNYKTDPSNKKSIGLIAQEVEKVFPELVITDNTEDKIKSVSYSNMVGVLVEAVKEQQKMIEELQATVKMLMSKL